jgi:hypothetical protein
MLFPKPVVRTKFDIFIAETLITGLVIQIIHVFIETLTTGLVIQINRVIGETLNIRLVLQLIRQ